MAQLNRLFRSISLGTDGSGLAFWCPGCEEMHQIPTAGPKAWKFNGDLERPTFSPSVLITCKWSKQNETGETMKDQCCHFFIEDGQFRFLNDCTHKLAGVTMPMADLPS